MESSLLIDRRPAGASLREPGLRAFFERMPDAMLFADEDARIVEANPAACALLECAREELLGRGVLHFTPGFAESPAGSLWQAFTGKGTGACAVRSRNGRTVRVRYRSLPELLPGLHGAVLRPGEEAPPEDGAARLRALLFHSTDIVVILDEAGAIRNQSLSGSGIHGYGAGELAGRPALGFVHPDDQALFSEAQEAVIRRADLTETLTYRARCADGAWTWFEATLINRLADPDVRGIVLSARDVSQRKRQEEVLQQYADRLSVIHEIDSALLAADTPRQIALAATSRLSLLIPGSSPAVVLFDRDHERAAVLAGRLPGMETDELPIAWFSDAALEAEQPFVGLPELAALEGPGRFLDALRGAGVRSLLAAPLRTDDGPIGLLAVAADRPEAFYREHGVIIREIADSLAVAIRSVQLRQEISASQAQLKALSNRLLEVQEAERRHIASELHDEIGQTLTALKITLEMSLRATREPAPAAVSEAKTLVDDLLARVRRLSLDLRPTILDDLGLVPALEWLFSRYEPQVGVSVCFRAFGLKRRLAPQLETGLYRIVQEALTNVARYSGVDEVFVLLQQEDDRVHLLVEDRGQGFDLVAVRAAASSSGLAGMRERALLLDGKLSILSAPGQGTRIMAVFPLLFAS